MEINTVIFDLGGVLIDWNPRYVYRTIFKTEEEIDWFFENVATHDWNENQDAGYPIAQATEELVAQHPEWEPQIRAYYGRWEEMLGGPIHETVEIFKELKQLPGLKTYALTNWSAETFHIALERYDFLHWFDGRLVSGEEKTRKPFPEFYQKLVDKFSIDPSKALFIDDSLRNIKGAEAFGIRGVHYDNPVHLRAELKRIGIFIS
ncbi:MAG TPA: HAD family phosphatase [Chitinophagaceae bacterium]|nr:HAD family phosphatase [Chitinophagaceae bacterium]